MANGAEWTARAAAGPVWAGHRDYSPGDDLRRIDWDLCARHDELRTRQVGGVVDGREYFLVDVSRSMSLGTPEKLAVARRIVAALACTALRGMNQVRVTAFADGLVADSDALRGAAAMPSLDRFLHSLRPERAPTDFARFAAGWAARYQRHGQVTVISDLCTPAGFERGLGQLWQRGYRTRIVHLYDPQDADPDVLGDALLSDVESGDRWDVTITEEHLEQYRRLFGEFLAGVRRDCNRHGWAWLQLRTDQLPRWIASNAE